jgi:hypothetical protein
MARCATSKGIVTKRQASATVAKISLAKSVSSNTAQVSLPNLERTCQIEIYGQQTLSIAQIMVHVTMTQKLAPAAHNTMVQHVNLFNATKVQMGTCAMEKETAMRALGNVVALLGLWGMRVMRHSVPLMIIILNVVVKIEVIAIDQMVIVCANSDFPDMIVQEVNNKLSCV